ncbi:MAG: NADP-dependent oxidoreductase [Gammaproteobacteria bacterium]
MTERVNRQWLMTSRPDGMVSRDNFTYQEVAVPAVADGTMLVRNQYMSFDPTLRAWMNEQPTYVSAIAIGEIMRCNAVGEVVESKLDGFSAGDLVQGGIGWQDYIVTDGTGIMPFQKLPPGTPPTMALSVLGVTGLTAYFGLLEIGKPKEGDVVVISGAAGATGSVVGQIAKLKGCTIIGIAGGEEKCQWLRDELGFDEVIDYKSGDVKAALKAATPNGIDIYFDNVGGEILDLVLNRINIGARIVLCGAISGYNSKGPGYGPTNYIKLIMQRARMEGFIILDYAPRFREAAGALVGWIQEGKLAYAEDVQEGLENAPEVFQRIFTGKNRGKQLLKVS